MNWIYPHGDPGLALFTAAVTAWGFSFPEGAKILELGAAETDWASRMRQQNPSFHILAVDARGREAGVDLEGDACRAELFEPESFDWIVMLGALEHFGLGYYGDTIHADGDILTMENVARWLKPGGSVYFDVPSNPTYRITENRHFRIYSPQALFERLLPPALHLQAFGYSLPEPDAGTWIEEPTEERVPYHYCAVWAMKAAD